MDANLIDNALAKIDSAEICIDPYPHILIDHFIEDDFFYKVVSELRNLHEITKIGLLEGQQKYDSSEILTVIKGPEMKYAAPLAYKLNEFLSSNDFFEAIALKMAPYAAASLQVDTSDISKSIKNRKYWSSINAIMPGKAVKRRGLHLDDKTVGINFLLYVRFKDDFSSGGSLQLLSQEDRLSITSRKMFLGQLLHSLLRPHTLTRFLYTKTLSEGQSPRDRL